MLSCLLLAIPFAYLIDYTNFVANKVVALVPCHTDYSLVLLCSSAGLLSLTTRPTVRFILSDLEILFSLFFSGLAHRLAHLRLFVLSCLFFILYPFDFLSSFVRSCLKFIQHGKPVFRAFVVSDINRQNFFFPFCIEPRITYAANLRIIPLSRTE